MTHRPTEKIEKPWGYELIWAKTSHYVGKILQIHAGHELSLQFHQQKIETIYLASGKMQLLLENDAQVLETFILTPGQAYHIAPPRKHRMIALEECTVFEVSTPQLDDVVRLEDRYGRVAMK